MTEDLTPLPGRIFVGLMYNRPHLITIKSVRRRKDGTPTSCRIIWESSEVIADATMKLPKDGKMNGWRRVTLAQVGLAKDLSQYVGSRVPTDAVVIVTKDRTGGEPVFT